jgi:hypothetical protein
MTLFAYLATPLFVLAVAGHAHARGQGGDWEMLQVFIAAALLAMPLYPLIELLAATVPAHIQPRLHYARLLAFDHGVPLVAAAAAAVVAQWFQRRGRADGAWRPVLLVAGLGGFFSVYAVLDQLSNHADPNLYRLVLLPMLRLVALTVTAYLLARAARGTRWWVVAVPAIPCVTAAVAYVGTVQQPGLAAAGGAALLAATLPMVFAHPVAEVSDETAR